ncbi:hypothetical protein [Inquilinus sp.]|uniref:hypothetical protein n=1 Tax=Inquilinus sp. TaxID=1932117 RepID=UPI00378317DE
MVLDLRRHDPSGWNVYQGMRATLPAADREYFLHRLSALRHGARIVVGMQDTSPFKPPTAPQPPARGGQAIRRGLDGSRPWPTAL